MENKLIKSETKPMVMQMILGKASKVELIRTFASLTTAAVVKGNYPTFGSLQRAYGVQKTEKVVAVMLHDLSSSFSGSLDEDDVEELCAEISSSLLRNLSMESIYMCCRNIKKTDNYGKLNVNKVLKTMIKHIDDIGRVVESANYNKHLSGKFMDTDRVSNKDAERVKDLQAFARYKEEKGS